MEVTDGLIELLITCDDCYSGPCTQLTRCPDCDDVLCCLCQDDWLDDDPAPDIVCHLCWERWTAHVSGA